MTTPDASRVHQMASKAGDTASSPPAISPFPPLAQRVQDNNLILGSAGNTAESKDWSQIQEMGSTLHTGMHCSFQDLLLSFTSRMPGEFYMGREGVNVLPENNSKHDPSSTSGNCSEFVGSKIGTNDIDAGRGSPSRLVVDESGYASSESSLYDVNSDDENYWNDCENNEHGGGSAREHNLDTYSYQVTDQHRCNATEPISTDIDEECTAGQEGEALKDCPCIAGNPFMHVMTELGEGDNDTTPWKKRNIPKKGEARPDCRKPKGMGPIEIALRNAPYRKTKYIFEPVLGITFDSDEEAYSFYNMYSWEVGFGIKKDSLVRNSKGEQTKRDFLCLCSGNKDNAKYKSKKTGCKAMIRLLRSEDDGWYISRHVSEHNHPLTETCGQKNEWKSHRKLDGSAVEMIKYLRENNVSLTKVHCIMGSMMGSMHNIPITKRSLRAICHRIAKDQMQDDVKKTLETFRQIRSEDPGFQFTVLPDVDNKIKALLWINGKSRDQFNNFGDVITFDTTYCTNIYKMPFGLFVGVNNHFQTTIFGGVFMTDETTCSFKWVFSEFLSLMGGKLPQTVFTDQCAAMASALKEVWEGATHLLCKWHIFKDAPSMLGPIYRKGSPFRKLFHKIINDMLTIDEFERAWTHMIELYSLQENKFLSNAYKKRGKWAKPYLKGTFCARMSSTQRSESANHMLKRFVPRNSSMNRFIVQFNKLLFDRNSAEDRAEFDTNIFNNVRDRAWPLEENAMKFYTGAAYELFRKEINKSTYYFARVKSENKEFEVIHVKPNKKLPWGRDSFIVTVVNEGERYDCECGLYGHFGMLCSHVLRVLVQLGVYEIPKAHIHKRWTRLARDLLPERLNAYQKDTLCMQSLTYRHSYLYVNALDLVVEGNKDLGAFDIVAKDIKKIQRKLRAYFEAKEKLAANGVGKGMLTAGNYYPSESDIGADSGYETEGRICNTYGAAGSSAGMSDSELLKIRAPAFSRPSGRPKEIRFKGTQDYYGKKQKRKRTTDMDNRDAEPNSLDSGKKKKLPRCGDCQILGHTATQCKKINVDVNSELPEF